jgi:hypothetical protein
MAKNWKGVEGQVSNYQETARRAKTTERDSQLNQLSITFPPIRVQTDHSLSRHIRERKFILYTGAQIILFGTVEGPCSKKSQRKPWVINH